MVISQTIQALTQKENIGYNMAKAAMKEIMDGQASDVQKSAYLTALSMKGETIEEITGSAEEMRAHSLAFPYSGECLEIVGTGGDRSNSFNISTTSSLVIAAAGIPVAKHGNRIQQKRSCRLLRGTRRQDRLVTGAGGKAVKRTRHLLPVCTKISHFHEICRSDPQGAWHPHDLQYLRSFDQPGTCQLTDHGCLRGSTAHSDGSCPS